MTIRGCPQQSIPSGHNGIWGCVWRQGSLLGSWGRDRVHAFSGLFVRCLQEEAKARRVKSWEPRALGLGESAWAIRAQNVPPFLATGKQKQTQQGKGGEAGEGTEQEGTGPAELSSFSGPATNSRTRESVWTAQLPEPFRPMLEPRLSLPALRGATHPSFIPGGKGRRCSNAAKRNPQLEKQTDKPGESGVWSISRIKVEAGSWLTGVKTGSPSLLC